MRRAKVFTSLSCDRISTSFAASISVELDIDAA
jgi:hypothetical protein